MLRHNKRSKGEIADNFNSIKIMIVQKLKNAMKRFYKYYLNHEGGECEYSEFYNKQKSKDTKSAKKYPENVILFFLFRVPK